MARSGKTLSDLGSAAQAKNLGNLYEYMTHCLMCADLNSDSGSRRSAGLLGRSEPAEPPLVRK
jgi:hypothetical protein